MSRSMPRAAVACGVLGFLGAVVAYWLVLPGLLFGLAAIVLGWRARSDHVRLGAVAMTLGVVAVLLVPAVNQVADDAEDWGRECALDPESDPNC